MAHWIEPLIVGLIIGVAVLLLARRLFASFGNKKCGCDSCPSKNATIEHPTKQP